ncbi:2'-5' RNA ligase [Desulfofundulus luciae]|uniref:RNA 2',3'-cyclic phosphodiesterase n=1 Tax=Desulfofundulus luciae TaxID=74702 RepID=A0ABU0B342_9FIRM|nr:RNA 2',3'-cyclic phosphodiesterase [Desulfofundulus luciae]MDQ0286704.1 2'-5' RNA ligase [Desulfofundulus luciae]
MGKTMRLFWAINLPDTIKERLWDIQRQLQGAGADAKWVEKENLHLTVHFLGEVEVSLINALISAAQKVLLTQKTFSVQLGGLGVFPDPRRPRVLWTGVIGGGNELQEIYRLVGEAMVPFGIPLPGRPFSPHLTLARLRSPRGVQELMLRVRELGDACTHLGTVQVSSVDLMQSELTRGGPIYTLMAQIRLKSR